MGKLVITNDELVREMFLCASGRIRNLTPEELKEVDSFLVNGVTDGKMNLRCGQMMIDPVFCTRVKKAIEKYGDVVIDIINDIFCGFEESA